MGDMYERDMIDGATKEIPVYFLEDDQSSSLQDLIRE